MTESLRKIVAKNIRLLRKRSGLSQQELAKHCGLTPRYACRMENDPQNLGLDTLGKIAETLGVPISELFGLPTKEPLPKNPEEAIELASRLLATYCDLFPKK